MKALALVPALALAAYAFVAPSAAEARDRGSRGGHGSYDSRGGSSQGRGYYGRGHSRGRGYAYGPRYGYRSHGRPYGRPYGYRYSPYARYYYDYAHPTFGLYGYGYGVYPPPPPLPYFGGYYRGPRVGVYLGF